MSKGLVIAITSPRGSGKTTRVDKTIARHTINSFSPFVSRSTSDLSLIELLHETSRLPRVGEQNGHEHFFVPGKSKQDREGTIKKREKANRYSYVVHYRNSLFGLLRSELDKLEDNIGLIPYGVENIVECSEALAAQDIDVVTVGIVPPDFEAQKAILALRGTKNAKKELAANLRSTELFEKIKEDLDYLIEGTTSINTSEHEVDIPHMDIEEAQRHKHIALSRIHRQAEPLHRIVLLEAERWRKGRENGEPYYAERFVNSIFRRSLGRIQKEVGMQPVTISFSDKRIYQLSERLNLDPQTIKTIFVGKPLVAVSQDGPSHIFTFKGMSTPPGSTFEEDVVNKHIEAVFGSYPTGKRELTYALSIREKDPRIIVRHEPPPNSAEAWGNHIRPKVERFWKKYVEGRKPSEDDQPIDPDDLTEMIRCVFLPTPKLLVERKSKQWAINERRVSRGEFPFLIRPEAGEKTFLTADAKTIYSGLTINYLQECYSLTRDSRFLEQARVGVTYISERIETVKDNPFFLMILAGELIPYAIATSDQNAKKVISEALHCLEEQYDETLGFVQHKPSSATLNSHLYTIPALVRWGIENDALSTDWEENLRRHLRSMQTSGLVRSDHSLAEAMTYDSLAGQFTSRSLAGYDPKNEGTSRFARIQTKGIDQFLSINDLETAQALAGFFTRSIGKSYQVFADPQSSVIEDNDAKTDGVAQLAKLAQETRNTKFYDIAVKLFLALYHDGIEFDETYHGIVTDVCYNLHTNKNVSSSTIKADLQYLQATKKIKERI